MTKVVILVKSGMVQAVASTEDIDIIILDKDEPRLPLDIYQPDALITEEEFARIRENGEWEE